MTRVPSPVVLGAAALIMVLGLFTGFRLLTADADTVAVTGPQCEPRTVAPGEPLTTNLVTVDVYNASRKAGLANRLSINLQRRGFLEGDIGNSQSEVAPERVAILTIDQEDPRVQLVARQFGDAVQFAEPDIEIDPDNVTILVADGFDALVEDAPREIETGQEITVCLPTVPVE